MVICEEDRATKLAMTNAKLNVPVVTLSTQDNAKLLQQLKSRSHQKKPEIDI